MLIDEEHRPRISDFGLSCTIGRLQPGLSYLQRLSSMSNVGAVRWAAPERLSGCGPHPSGDIYSFGCMMFEVTTPNRHGVLATTEFSPQVLSGDIPWKEKTNYQVIALKLEAHRPPSRPNHAAVRDKHWALMVRCWTCPQRRPTAREVVVVVQTFFSVDTNDFGGHGRGTPETWVFFFFFFLSFYISIYAMT